MSGSSSTDILLVLQAGAAAAFTVDLLVYPLDTLKTRRQGRDVVDGSRGGAASAASAGTRPARHMRGLYQGIGIVVLATLPASATFFSVYERARAFLGRRGPGLGVPQPVVHSAASVVAELASCLVLTPAEVVKQNAQMLQRGAARPSSAAGGGGGGGGSRHAWASMQALRQLGGRGAGRKLLSGYSAMVARNLPFTGIQFPAFEAIRERIWARRSGSRGDGAGYGPLERRGLLETGVITGMSAGLSGSFAAVVTTPMDVVKTRMMLAPDREPDAKQGSHGRGKSLDGLAVARQVYRERGLPGLFRGGLLRAVWTAIGSGLYLGMYEVSKLWLTQGKDEEPHTLG